MVETVDFLENSKSVIHFIVDLDGNILFSNNGYKNILGYTEKNIKSKFINPEFEKIITGYYNKKINFDGIITFEKEDLNSSFCSKGIMKDNQIVFTCEYDTFEIENLYKEMATLNNKISNTNREMIKKSVILENLLSELEEKNQELEKINEEKSKILGIVAHDLRGPLGGIKEITNYIVENSLEIMKKDMIDIIGTVRDSSTYLLDLVNDVLDVSAIETGKLNLNIEKIDLIVLAEETLKISKELAKKKKITILSEFCCEKVFIEIDKMKISQVINNLLQNAIKYSYPNESIKLIVLNNEAEVVVKVVDEGPGIPELEEYKLFNMFVTTSRRPTGREHSSGLGLYIAKKVIEAHGGEIGYEKNIGKGATFYFKLKK